MSQAFAISDMDVQNVLIHRFRFQGEEASESRAAEMIEGLDDYQIERAALYGDDLDAQTDLALDAIAEQLLSVFAVRATSAVLDGQAERIAILSPLDIDDRAEKLSNDMDMAPLKALLKNAASVPFTPALTSEIERQLVAMGVLRPSDFPPFVQNRA